MDTELLIFALNALYVIYLQDNTYKLVDPHEPLLWS